MGIVLLPVFLIAFVVWVLCLIFLIIRISKKQMTSLWSIPIGLAFFTLTYILIVFSWTGQKEIHALTPLFVLPFTHVVLPGLIGLGGIFIPKENKLLNVIGYAICISAIISPLILVMFEGLTQADTFIDIKLIH